MAALVGRKLTIYRNGQAVSAVVRPCPENTPRPPKHLGEVPREGVWVLIATARDQFAAVFDGADFYVGDTKLRVIPELFELRPQLSPQGHIEFARAAPDTTDPRVAELMRYLARQ